MYAVMAYNPDWTNFDVGCWLKVTDTWHFADKAHRDVMPYTKAVYWARYLSGIARKNAPYIKICLVKI